MGWNPFKEAKRIVDNTTRQVGDVFKEISPDVDAILQSGQNLLTGKPDEFSRRQAENKQRQNEVIQRAKDLTSLAKIIKEDESISDRTRKELLFSIGRVDPNVFKTKQHSNTRLDFKKSDNPESFDAGVPDVVTNAPDNPFEKQGVQLTDELLSALPTTIGGIKARFTEARGAELTGDSLFAARKRSEKIRKRLKDQPGERQFLIEPPGVGAGPGSAVPILTER